MLPVLHDNTEFKKDYNFNWQIAKLPNLVPLKAYKTMSVDLLALEASFVESSAYVSQLAESVALPDDEIEVNDYDVGFVKIPSAVGVKMNDIVVTYLEDTKDTVYNFHKSWMNMIRPDSSFNMNPIKPFCASALYGSCDNTISEIEYRILQESSRGWMSEVLSSINVSGVTTNVAKQLIHMKGIQVFPYVFPISIFRGTMNKGGTGLAKIVVRYKRIPNIKKIGLNKGTLQKLEGDMWINQ